MSRDPRFCPTCGAAMGREHGVPEPPNGPALYDLLALATSAARDHAADEGARARVTQQEIRRMLERRRRARP